MMSVPECMNVGEDILGNWRALPRESASRAETKWANSRQDHYHHVSGRKLLTSIIPQLAGPVSLSSSFAFTSLSLFYFVLSIL